MRNHQRNEVIAYFFFGVICFILCVICLVNAVKSAGDLWITCFAVSLVATAIFFFGAVRTSNMEPGEYNNSRAIDEKYRKERENKKPRKRRHSTFLILGGLAWLISDILKDSKRHCGRKTDYMPGITKDRYH